MPSSSAIRLITIAMPSIASKKPATPAARSERVSALATRKTTSTVRLPSTATASRQPKLEPGPVSAMPRAISHLPSGGWTTKAPVGIELRANGIRVPARECGVRIVCPGALVAEQPQ